MQQFSEETYKLDEKPTWLRYENFRLHSHHDNILFAAVGRDETCKRECFVELGLNCYASSHGKIFSPIYDDHKHARSDNICFMLNSTYSYSYGI